MMVLLYCFVGTKGVFGIMVVFKKKRLAVMVSILLGEQTSIQKPGKRTQTHT